MTPREHFIQDMLEVLVRNNVHVERDPDYDGAGEYIGETVVFWGEEIRVELQEILDRYTKENDS